MEIYNVPAERRYWVVRAEGGKYYDNFTKFGLIALGHLDCLDIPETKDGHFFDQSITTLTDSFKKYHDSKGQKKQRTSLHLSQIKAFIYDMSVGDWVLTVGCNQVRFGRIISKAYIKKDSKNIIHDPNSGRQTEMDFNLRRSVQWGPSLLKCNLPYGLSNSLKANQTIFCLDKNWDSIYHSLYPAFQKNEELYLSAKINTKERIKNQDILVIFNLLNEIEIEIIGKELSLGSSLENFDKIYKEYIDEEKLSITTKAQFHSPGEVWNRISSFISDRPWLIYTVLVYISVFGNTAVGFDGILDLETRQKIYNIALSRIEINKAEKTIETLKLKLPNSDTSKLEDSSNDKN